MIQKLKKKETEQNKISAEQQRKPIQPDRQNMDVNADDEVKLNLFGHYIVAGRCAAILFLLLRSIDNDTNRILPVTCDSTIYLEHSFFIYCFVALF